MNTNFQPPPLRPGDYVMNFPLERPGDCDLARQAMKRNGCRCLRFERVAVELDAPLGRVKGQRMTAHGYVAWMNGGGVEAI